MRLQKFITCSTAIALGCALFCAPATAGLFDIADKAKDTVLKSNDKVAKPAKSTDTPKNVPATYTGPKKRLGVMEMDVKVTATTSVEPTQTGGVMQTDTIYIPPPTDFGTGLTEMLTTSLVNSGRFILLERKALADIQNEQNLAASGQVDKDSAAEPGKLLGAQTLIRGAVTEYTYKRSSTGGSASVLKGVNLSASKAEAAVVLDVRLYDVTTGQIIDSVKAEGRAKSSAAAVGIDKPDWKMAGSGFSQTPLGEATRQAIDRAVAFICERMEKVPWEGRIAEIETDDAGVCPTIYINAGSRTGLKEGDVLDIMRPGRAITDPETRVVIGRTKDKRLGSCRIDTITDNLSIALPVDGDGFQVNDIVRMMDPNAVKPTPEPAKEEQSTE